MASRACTPALGPVGLQRRGMQPRGVQHQARAARGRGERLRARRARRPRARRVRLRRPSVRRPQREDPRDGHGPPRAPARAAACSSSTRASSWQRRRLALSQARKLTARLATLEAPGLCCAPHPPKPHCAIPVAALRHCLKVASRRHHEAAPARSGHPGARPRRGARACDETQAVARAGAHHLSRPGCWRRLGRSGSLLESAPARSSPPLRGPPAAASSGPIRSPRAAPLGPRGAPAAAWRPKGGVGGRGVGGGLRRRLGS